MNSLRLIRTKKRRD